MTTPEKKQRYDEATHQWIDAETPPADDALPVGKTGWKKPVNPEPNPEPSPEPNSETKE